MEEEENKFCFSLSLHLILFLCCCLLLLNVFFTRWSLMSILECNERMLDFLSKTHFFEQIFSLVLFLSFLSKFFLSSNGILLTGKYFFVRPYFNECSVWMCNHRVWRGLEEFVPKKCFHSLLILSPTPSLSLSSPLFHSPPKSILVFAPDDGFFASVIFYSPILGALSSSFSSISSSSFSFPFSQFLRSFNPIQSYISLFFNHHPGFFYFILSLSPISYPIPSHLSFIMEWSKG